jgi:hypothetical protein
MGLTPYFGISAVTAASDLGDAFGPTTMVNRERSSRSLGKPKAQRQRTARLNTSEERHGNNQPAKGQRVPRRSLTISTSTLTISTSTFPSSAMVCAI